MQSQISNSKKLHTPGLEKPWEEASSQAQPFGNQNHTDLYNGSQSHGTWSPEAGTHSCWWRFCRQQKLEFLCPPCSQEIPHVVILGEKLQGASSCLAFRSSMVAMQKPHCPHTQLLTEHVGYSRQDICLMQDSSNGLGVFCELLGLHLMGTLSLIQIPQGHTLVSA